MQPLFLIAFIFFTSCAHSLKSNLNSVVFTQYGVEAYDEKSNLSYLSLIDQLGFKTVSLLFTCHTQNIYSHDVDCLSSNSPDLKTTLNFLSQKKKEGYQTSLRIYVDLLSGDWRAYWDPKDKINAFKNIETEILRMISMTEKDTIDLLIIGAEYEKLTQPKYKKNWVQLIKQIRRNFNGLLTYGANTNLSDQKIPELQWVPFWNELDYIGIDYYYPVTKSKNNVSSHQSQLEKLLLPLRNYNKKIFVNEVGIPVAEKGYLKPFEWKWPKNSKKSQDNQAQYLSDFIKAAHLQKINDIQIWRFMPEEEKTFPFGYIIESPATLDVLKKLNL